MSPAARGLSLRTDQSSQERPLAQILLADSDALGARPGKTTKPRPLVPSFSGQLSFVTRRNHPDVVFGLISVENGVDLPRQRRKVFIEHH